MSNKIWKNLDDARALTSKQTLVSMFTVYENEPGKQMLLRMKSMFPAEYQRVARAQETATGRRATVNSARLFYFLQGRFPKCPGCGLPSLKCLKADHPKDFGKRCCSMLCANKIKQERMKDTTLKKYGASNIFASKKFSTERVSYLQRKYGDEVTGPTKVPGAAEKIKATSLAKFGVEHFAQADQVIAKKRETSLKRYGVTSTTQTEFSKRRLRETSLETYGVEHPSKSLLVKERKRLSSQAKFGTDNPLQSEICKTKAKDSFKARYGVPHPMKNAAEFLRRTSYKSYQGSWRGHLVTYQGYELKVLQSLERNKKVKGIKMWGRAEGITYRYKSKTRTYYPDFLVLLSSGEKLIVEVKSKFTLLGSSTFNVYEKNLAKFRAASAYASAYGYEFVVAVYSHLGVGWIRQPTHRLRSRVSQL